VNCNVRPWNGCSANAWTTPFSEQNDAALSRSASLPTLKPSRLQACLCLAQDQRVVLMLLAAAEIHRPFVGILDMETDSRLIKFAAPFEIGHVEHDVA
jgi:hypothetical protein